MSGGSAASIPDPAPGRVSAELARPDRRRPRSVDGLGHEPDPRFSMANERTALAWIRTGLAFVPGGIALTSVSALLNAVVIIFFTVTQG